MSVALLATSTPVPPAQLEPESFSARLYDTLAPLAARDPDVGWALLILVNAVGVMYQLLDELVRDTPDGPGWSVLLDLDRCPDVALPWLAQFVGVRLLPGHTPVEDRARIASTDGFRRGTPAAMRGAAQSTLTGSKTVVFAERDGDPYALTVITFQNETPDQAMTLRALVAQKPGGLVLNYNAAVGQTYDVARLTNASYAVMTAKYPTYGGLLVDQPGA